MHYNGAYSKSAGVSRVVLSLGKALEEKGVQVDYAFGYDAPQAMFNYLQPLKGTLHFLHHTPLTALFFANFIKDKDYDIVHSHTPEAAFDAVIARLLLRKKYKIVVHLHGLDKAIYEEWKKELKLKRTSFNLTTFLYLKASIFKNWFAIKLADTFTCVSKTVKKEAKKFYGIDAVVVPNAVDCKEFKKFNKIAVRKQLGFNASDFIVLFVGNVVWRKGLHYLVSAFEQLSMENKLVIVGLRDKKFEKWLEKKGDERILNVGHIPINELAKYFSAADVLCVPSINEPFGLVYAEACCFGLPCIACKGTGAEEIIENGFNGFLARKRSVKELKEALEKLKDRKLRARFSKNAKLKAKQLCWKRSAEKVLKIYNELIK